MDTHIVQSFHLAKSRRRRLLVYQTVQSEATNGCLHGQMDGWLATWGPGEIERDGPVNQWDRVYGRLIPNTMDWQQFNIHQETNE